MEIDLLFSLVIGGDNAPVGSPDGFPDPVDAAVAELSFKIQQKPRKQ